MANESTERTVTGGTQTLFGSEGCVMTHSHLWPNPLDLASDLDQVSIEDIALGLSREPRFSGQTRDDQEPYTVAEHSVWVYRYVCERDTDPLMRFRTLLHDTTEAFLRDFPRPIKKSLHGFTAEYLEAESQCWRAIVAKFMPGEDASDPRDFDIIAEADDAAAKLEWGQLMVRSEPLTLPCYDWRQAREIFLASFTLAQAEYLSSKGASE